MYLIKKSGWCATWKDKLRGEMGYQKMKEIFIVEEWTTEVQEYYYKEFTKQSRNNSSYTNFLDYFNYWCEKFVGTRHGEVYILEQFRNNLPDRIQAKIDLNKVRNIQEFARVLAKIPYKDLEWSSLHLTAGMDKRKEILSNMSVKDFEKKTTTPTQSNNQATKLCGWRTGLAVLCDAGSVGVRFMRIKQQFSRRYAVERRQI